MRRMSGVLIAISLLLFLTTAYLWAYNLQLGGEVTSLKALAASLNTKNQELNDKLRSFNSLLNDCMNLNDKLLKNNTNLQKEVMLCQYQTADLRKKLELMRKWLKDNITLLKEKVSNLSVENFLLQKQLTNYKVWLAGNKSLFDAKVHELKKALNEYRRESTVEKLFTEPLTVNSSLLNTILNASIKEGGLLAPVVLNEVPPSEAFETTFIWVLLNMYYQPDPYIFVSDGEGGYKINNLWKLPNETVLNEGGDCEDLSLLTYSILKAYGSNAWLLVATSPQGGHAVVIGELSGGWYLLDTAGDWINGYGLYFRIKAVNPDNRIIEYLLQPLDLNPQDKENMVKDGIATPVWYDYLFGSVVNLTEISPEGNLTNLLWRWNYYWGFRFTHYTLLDIGMRKDFSSLSELIGYLEWNT